MSYRTILVHVDSSPRAAARIRYACQLAEANEAHLTGLFVASPVFSGGLGPFPAPPETYAAQYLALERDAAAAKAGFERLTQAYRPRVEWRQQLGPCVDAFNLHARYHDLLLLGQRDAAAPVDGVPDDFVASVVMGCGRPALVLPYAGDFTGPSRHILVAWNGSREATRAVTDALPLLREADRVTVLTISPQVGDHAHGELPGADIGLYLTRHGVHVEVARDVAFSRDVGEVLLSAAADRAADAIVMGLYGHSRLRELMMGGASRTLLGAMTIPVFMSH
ncbi:universal stress protein [Chitinimonas sp.]|uniref:universal stress protein n=1 Tax=Chitinimonas sp. TaxID=1934313 RepID=UPI0035AF6531